MQNTEHALSSCKPRLPEYIFGLFESPYLKSSVAKPSPQDLLSSESQHQREKERGMERERGEGERERERGGARERERDRETTFSLTPLKTLHS